jgi:hypothetical protein
MLIEVIIIDTDDHLKVHINDKKPAKEKGNKSEKEDFRD